MWNICIYVLVTLFSCSQGVEEELPRAAALVDAEDAAVGQILNHYQF